MPLVGRFSRTQLHAIIDEATIYMCACPAQLCQQMLGLVALYEYQEQCGDRDANQQVHQEIAIATAESYAVLEECLDRVLTMEGWDRATLSMPEGLRALRLQALE